MRPRYALDKKVRASKKILLGVLSCGQNTQEYATKYYGLGILLRLERSNRMY
jgi:hypothetical protein